MIVAKANTARLKKYFPFAFKPFPKERQLFFGRCLMFI
jgi:hypothetical protein